MNKDQFLDACLKHCFDGREIEPKALRNATEIDLSQRCVFIEIDGRDITVLKKESHTVEQRLQIFLSFLREVISKYELTLNFRFILNTADEDQQSEYPAFQFSRECASLNNLVIPDPHLISKYLGMNVNDSETFDEKIPKIVFRGTDTGVYPDAESNERLYFCNRFKDDDCYNFKISRFLGYTKDHLQRFNYDIEKIEGYYMSFDEQARYRYIADINGNTIAWDRNCWALALNSVLIKFQKDQDHKYETWYTNYLYSHQIVPVFGEQNDISELTGREDIIIKKQKEFSKILLSRDVNLEYLKRVLLLYQEKYQA